MVERGEEERMCHCTEKRTLRIRAPLHSSGILPHAACTHPQTAHPRQSQQQRERWERESIGVKGTARKRKNVVEQQQTDGSSDGSRNVKAWCQ
uniref:Uncharacterized protein n=1 Tax=Knipowitschia caucasica TaxID=637954 RepID=A0AAV2KCT2_KNICA